MKKSFIVIVLSLLLQNAESQIHIVDTIPKFPEDVSISIYSLENSVLRLFIKRDTSLNLIKEYRTVDNTLLLTREIDSSGDNHGNYYYYDTLTGSQTFGKFIHDNVMELYTISSIGDTIYKETRMSDSIVQIVDFSDGLKTVSQVNNNYIYNGLYIVTDVKSELVVKRGEYRAIKETDILDLKKYMFYLDKYGHIYSFRNVEPETEIPVGDWYYYDDTGKLTRTEKYNWEGCIRGID